MNKKVSPAHVQLEYLDRISAAYKSKDSAMLQALYYQCEQLNIPVPHYELTGRATSVLAVEKREDGSLTMHMRKNVEIDGVSKPLEDWCKEIGLSRGALRYRIISGQSLKEALTSPKVIYYTQRT